MFSAVSDHSAEPSMCSPRYFLTQKMKAIPEKSDTVAYEVSAGSQCHLILKYHSKLPSSMANPFASCNMIRLDHVAYVRYSSTMPYVLGVP